MTNMVQDLLLLARLDAGDTLNLQEFPLAQVVITASSDAQVLDSTKAYVLELDESAADITVVGDPDRIHQALMNLLRNAQRHTPPGTEITVAMRVTDNHTVQVMVADNGPGIAQELQHTIFDRFVRGDSARSRDTGSTGLGMSIVQAIMASHGGSVEVSSRPGLTRFTAELPLP